MMLALALAAVLHASAVATGTSPSGTSPSGASASNVPSDTVFCAGAAAFLRDTQRMEAVVEPDSINDWRSQRRVGGCRITAAGGTTLSHKEEVTRLYERLRAEGWTRTPDPRDAPNEGSLRYRRDGADCLFNYNVEAMLFTDAETLVLERLRLASREVRYHVFVLCLAVQSPSPRGRASMTSRTSSAPRPGGPTSPPRVNTARQRT
jgi:hypothetical protein